MALPFPLASGTYRYVTTADSLETALLAATTGDVVVLSEGTHTLGFATLTSIPDVTIRGMGQDKTTLHITDPQHFVDQYACFYDLKFTVPVSGTPFLLFQCESTAWFESVTFNCLPGFEGAPLTGETITFKNCTFDAITNYEAYDFGVTLDGSTPLFGLSSTDGLHNGRVIFENCVFLGDPDWSTGGASVVNAQHTVDSSGSDRAISFVACTFYGPFASSTDLYNGILRFLFCVQYAPGALSAILNTPDDSGGETGYGNYAELASGADNNSNMDVTITKLYLHDYPSVALRNESPARDSAANDYVVADHIYRTTDTLLTRSSGAYQWVPEASALYEPWYLDPADGLVVSMEDSNSTNFAERPVLTQVNSPLDFFNHLRRIVYDIIHPCRCIMFWDSSGSIVIRSEDYAFSLSTTPGTGSARAFGSLSFSGVYTTET